MGEVFSTVLLFLDEKTELSPVVELTLSTGAPLPEDRQQNREDYNAGLISLTTAMSHAGVIDPDAEKELIRREREEEEKIASKSFVEEFSDSQEDEDADQDNDTELTS